MKSVYVMKSDTDFKIGISNNPRKRVHTFRLANPNIALIYVSPELSNAYMLESKLHHILSYCAKGREWFSGVEEEPLLELVKTTVMKYGEHKETETAHRETFSTPIEKLYGTSIRALEEETNRLHAENEIVIELINLVLGKPKLKNIIGGLLGLGWDYCQIRSFLAENGF